jgi:hypothetical protein
MKSKAYVPKETSIYMRYLFQDKGLRGNELLKRFPKYSKATIYRHAKLPINDVATFDKGKHSKGRPRKLSIRDESNVTLSGTCVSVGQQSGTFPHPDYGRWLASVLMYLPGVFEEYLIDTVIRIYTRVRKDLKLFYHAYIFNKMLCENSTIPCPP